MPERFFGGTLKVSRLQPSHPGNQPDRRQASMEEWLIQADGAHTDLTRVQAEGQAIAELTEMLRTMAEGEDDDPHPATDGRQT